MAPLYSESGTPSPQSILEHFHYAEKKPHSPLIISPRTPVLLTPGQPLAYLNSTDLPTTDLSYTQSHTLCDLL